MSFTAPNQIKSRLKKIAIGALLLYIMIGTFLYAFQQSMIFHPWDLPQDHAYEFQHEFEELFLKTEEEAIINALHFKAENPKGVILYFHGNAGHLQRWGTITSHLVDKGFDLFIMDYRTFGKSVGKLSENALYKDAQFCYDYLTDSYLAEDIIIQYGGSAKPQNSAELLSQNDIDGLLVGGASLELASFISMVQG